MTLDEAIKHCKDKYEELKNKCIVCANNHKQLEEWLEELKIYREKNKGDNEMIKKYRQKGINNIK